MNGSPEANVERRSGVTLWRQIADRIRTSIVATGEPGDRLPPEKELAAHFGVNRHTVRAAIGALVQEGVLQSEQGRGTFIRQRQRVAYPIGRRTRFSEGLAGQAGNRRSIVVKDGLEPASEDIARKIGVTQDSAVIRLDTLSLADNLPVSVATHWFPADRFADLPKAARHSGSITAALAACGVTDYLRDETVIEAGHGSAADLDALNLAPGAVVLTTRAVNVDDRGRAIQFSITRFAADRVTLTVDHAHQEG